MWVISKKHGRTAYFYKGLDLSTNSRIWSKNPQKARYFETELEAELVANFLGYPGNIHQVTF